MSADNTIVVLGTLCHWRKEGATMYRVPQRKVYRVAHVGAWDNFYWYQNNERYNLGAYLLGTFKNSPVFEGMKEALEFAGKMQKEIGYVEYGIQIEDTDYTFYGD